MTDERRRAEIMECTREKRKKEKKMIKITINNRNRYETT